MGVGAALAFLTASVGWQQSKGGSFRRQGPPGLRHCHERTEAQTKMGIQQGASRSKEGIRYARNGLSAWWDSQLNVDRSSGERFEGISLKSKMSLGSLGFTCLQCHVVPFGLTCIHSVTLNLTWPCLVSKGISCARLAWLGFTWPRLSAGVGRVGGRGREYEGIGGVGSWALLIAYHPVWENVGLMTARHG